MGISDLLPVGTLQALDRLPLIPAETILRAIPTVHSAETLSSMGGGSAVYGVQ